MRQSPFLLLCGTGLFAIFSSTLSKSPVLPLFASNLGADPGQVGAVASVSAFAGVVFSIPAGYLSDRWGRKRILMFSALILATAPFFYLVIRNLWQLALVRFYHGLATALFVPVAMALVADLFQHGRGERLGWFSTSTLAGRFLAPLTGGSLLAFLAASPALGFRAVYVVCWISGALALVLGLRIPDPNQDRKSGSSANGKWTALKTVLLDRGILTTSGVEASILFAYGAFETFLPLFTIQSGMSARDAGVFLSAQVVTLALTKPLMGKFSDLHGRQTQILSGVLAAALCMIGMGLVHSFPALLALSITFGLCLSVVTSATSALIADLSPPDGCGSAMGVLGSIMDIGHTTGPLVSGIVASYYGVGRCFFAPAILLLIAAVAFRRVMVYRDRSRETV